MVGFERFTERARQVVILAQDEAHLLKHNYLGIGQGDEVATGQIPFSPRAEKVLELAMREALSLGHGATSGPSTSSVWCARRGVAARILLDFDADAEKIHNEIIRMLSGPGRRETRNDGRFGDRGGAGAKGGSDQVGRGRAGWPAAGTSSEGWCMSAAGRAQACGPRTGRPGARLGAVAVDGDGRCPARARPPDRSRHLGLGPLRSTIRPCTTGS